MDMYVNKLAVCETYVGSFRNTHGMQLYTYVQTIALWYKSLLQCVYRFCGHVFTLPYKCHVDHLRNMIYRKGMWLTIANVRCSCLRLRVSCGPICALVLYDCVGRFRVRHMVCVSSSFQGVPPKFIWPQNKQVYILCTHNTRVSFSILWLMQVWPENAVMASPGILEWNSGGSLRKCFIQWSLHFWTFQVTCVVLSASHNNFPSLPPSLLSVISSPSLISELLPTTLSLPLTYSSTLTDCFLSCCCLAHYYWAAFIITQTTALTHPYVLPECIVQ